MLIGTIAAIAIPRLTSMSRRAEVQAAATAFLNMDKAIQIAFAETGVIPGERLGGDLPPEFEPYIGSATFAKRPPLGVVWDWNPLWGPNLPNISIWSDAVPTDQWEALDAMMDDGSLASGSMQRVDDHLMWHVQLPE